MTNFVLGTYQRLLTWTFSLTIAALTWVPVASFLFIVKCDDLDPALRSRLIIRFGSPFGPFNSISMYPAFAPCFTNEPSSEARPRT